MVKQKNFHGIRMIDLTASFSVNQSCHNSILKENVPPPTVFTACQAICRQNSRSSASTTCTQQCVRTHTTESQETTWERRFLTRYSTCQTVGVRALDFLRHGLCSRLQYIQGPQKDCTRQLLLYNDKCFTECSKQS